MDPGRFLELYVSESQENLRLLQKSLLALESGGPAGAVDEAFRAAHTLKGLSAAMGYRAPTELAHRIEDRLDSVRAGRSAVDGELVDALLSDADALESAVTAAIRAGPDAPGHGIAADEQAAGAAAAPPPGSEVPEGTACVAYVRLRADAPIKSVRAMLIMRALADQPGVLGFDPATFDDDFDGQLRVFLSPAADPAAAEAAIIGAGEVETVDLVSPSSTRPQTAAATSAPVAVQRQQLRVDAARLDRVAEGISELSVLFGRAAPAGGLPPAVQELMARMGTMLGTLQRDVLALRMAPVREAFERLPRVVRDAARLLDRQVELILEGEDVELDRAILEELGGPLVHLLRNAVDHGIEPAAERVAAGKPARGRIRVAAERERSSVRIMVADDGRGIPAERVVERATAAGLMPRGAAGGIPHDELFRLLSHPGLSTSEQVSAVSGRGVGMDAVVSGIRALGGAIDLQTQPGQGTTFTIRLPITLALAQALRVRVGGEDYAIPVTHIAEAVELEGLPVYGERDVLRLRDEDVPLVRMSRVLQVASGGGEQAAVIAEMGERRAALAVDALIGREQILVKSFAPVVGMLPYFSGATVLADGRPALVLDPLSVM